MDQEGGWNGKASGNAGTKVKEALEGLDTVHAFEPRR